MQVVEPFSVILQYYMGSYLRNMSIGMQMFVSDPPYDKTLQQLQGFLSRLVAEEKLEFREGIYRRRQM